jgi:hypothetical protein
MSGKGIQVSNKGVYNGNFCDTLREGFGIFQFSDGMSYEGNFHLGL